MSKIIGLNVDKADEQKRATDAAQKAKGEALAEKLIAHVRDQSTSLKRYLMDIAALDNPGRKGFRVFVSAHLKQIAAHVKAAKGTPEEEVYYTAGRSAGVRLSEAVTFSKAVDLGWHPDFEGVPYTAMIGQARTMLRSESAVGPTNLRGRKATPVLDKIKAYILKLELTPEQMTEAASLVTAMSDLKKVAAAPDMETKKTGKILHIVASKPAPVVSTTQVEGVFDTPMRAAAGAGKNDKPQAKVR